MRGYRQCTIPLDNGHDCWNEPADNPFGVCEPHWRYLAQSWKVNDRHIDRHRCPFCELLSAVANGDGKAFCINPQCGMSSEVLVLERATDDELAELIAEGRRRRDAGPQQVVYYMSWGNRIKIGTTANLAARMKAIYHDECLAVEKGGYDIENQRHRQFSQALIAGQREWFSATPELVEHINLLRKQNGPPLTAAQRWNTDRSFVAA